MKPIPLVNKCVESPQPTPPAEMTVSHDASKITVTPPAISPCSDKACAEAIAPPAEVRELCERLRNTDRLLARFGFLPENPKRKSVSDAIAALTSLAQELAQEQLKTYDIKALESERAELRAEVEQLKARGGNSLLKNLEWDERALKEIEEARARVAELERERDSWKLGTTELCEEKRTLNARLAAVTASEQRLAELVGIAKCPACDGSGGIPVQVSEHRVVSRDMAMDAGDPSMEGSTYSEEQWEQQQCQWCDERAKALAARAKEDK